MQNINLELDEMNASIVKNFSKTLGPPFVCLPLLQHSQ